MIDKLKIENLDIFVNKKLLLKNINFDIKTNDIIAIIGPNGAGKSSLIKTIMHHYAFNAKKGNIVFNKLSLLKKQTNEIAKLGFFYLAQNPIELDSNSIQATMLICMNITKESVANESPLVRKDSSLVEDMDDVVN